MLQQKAQLLGVADKVNFAGAMAHEDILKSYREADILVNPSLSESFGMTLVEAMSSGTPVIATRIGGMPEIVEESGGGFVYERESELLAAMDHLLEEPASRGEMGLRGHRAYHRNWTTEAHLENYLGLIRKLSAAREHPKRVTDPN